MHFRQGEQVMRAGKHALIEIPITDSDAERQTLAQITEGDRRRRDGRPCAALQPEPPMDPPADRKGRVENPADGRADLFLPPHQYQCAGKTAVGPIICFGTTLPHDGFLPVQTGEKVSECYAVQGPPHPELGIAMDMGIVLMCRPAPSAPSHYRFNNDGPIGSFFRYICDNGTYNAYYDDLANGREPDRYVQGDVSMDGINSIDREFIAAIRENASPTRASRSSCPACACWGRLERIVDPKRRAHA